MERKPPDDGDGFILRWGGGVLLLAAIGALWPLRWAPTCLFFRVTGHPCFTCGATRALKALAGGALGEAIRLQPLLVLGGMAVVGAMAVCGIRRWMGCAGWSWAHWSRPMRGFLLGALIVAILANWIYLWVSMGAVPAR